MPAMMIIAPKKAEDPYCIPKPDGFSFDESEMQDGMNIQVKVKPDGDDKLRIVEVEGEPVGGPVVNEKPKEKPVPFIPDMDEDGE